MRSLSILALLLVSYSAYSEVVYRVVLRNAKSLTETASGYLVLFDENDIGLWKDKALARLSGYTGGAAACFVFRELGDNGFLPPVRKWGDVSKVREFKGWSIVTIVQYPDAWADIRFKLDGDVLYGDRTYAGFYDTEVVDPASGAKRIVPLKDVAEILTGYKNNEMSLERCMKYVFRER